MTDDANPDDQSKPSDQPWSEQIRHSQVGARVPSHVAKGVFSTGAVVLEGAQEFALDFLLRMAKPQQVVARVILTPYVLKRFADALRENLRMYENQFGDQRTKPLSSKSEESTANESEQSSESSPGSPGSVPGENVAMAGAGIESNEKSEGDQSAANQPSNSGATITELYDSLKFPDEMLAGVYANAVMIGHTPSEFSFDFITTFFPRSVVACRVFMSAGAAPVLLNSLTHAYDQHLRKRQQPPPEA